MKFKLILLCLFVLAVAKAQDKIELMSDVKSPTLGVKTNLLYDVTTSFNLGLELKTSPKYTIDLSVNYNPWTFSNNKKLKHIMVQPEFRYWTCEAFNGHFLGIHALYSYYNVGGVKLPLGMMPSLTANRYQGNLYGVGISYGYQWYLSPRWNIEATIGVGYVHSDFDRYDCQTCGDLVKSGNENYWGPTKVGLSVIYLIK